jgi:hypothetical protein
MRATWRMFVFAAVLVALGATQVRAMYSPNPAGRWAENRFFVAGDLQYNQKDLEHNGDLDDEVGLFVRPSYSLAKNVTIYGRIGFQDADHLDAEFAIGGGIQAAYVIPNARDWAIGGSFDYLFWNAQTNGGSDVDYHEFQLTPAVSWNPSQLRALTPYAGIPINFLSGDLDEENTVGLMLGSNYDLNEHVRFDAQVRFVSETGFFLSAGYLF